MRNLVPVILLLPCPMVCAQSFDLNYEATVTSCPFGDPAGPCGIAEMPGPIVVGSPISGFITVSETAQGGVAGPDEIVDFSFDVAGVFQLGPPLQSTNELTSLAFDAEGNTVHGVFALNLPDLLGPGSGIDGLLTDTYVGSTGTWEITIPAFGNAFVVGGTSQATPVPEPSSAALLLCGLVAFAVPVARCTRRYTRRER